MAGEEKRFENKIKRYLDSKGIWYVKFFANAFTRSGIPDILCCVNGKFVSIEVKAETGRLSDLQMIEMERICKSGGIALCIRPSQFDWLKNKIEVMLDEG